MCSTAEWDRTLAALKRKRQPAQEKRADLRYPRPTIEARAEATACPSTPKRVRCWAYDSIGGERLAVAQGYLREPPFISDTRTIRVSDLKVANTIPDIWAACARNLATRWGARLIRLPSGGLWSLSDDPVPEEVV